MLDQYKHTYCIIRILGRACSYKWPRLTLVLAISLCQGVASNLNQSTSDLTENEVNLWANNFFPCKFGFHSPCSW